ncbi:MAG: hypothetical protein GTN38_03145 [Candidatus Aenigmarchaeota archaeon]|nr:hypothetical protein [Candidatus Aenigmarchaeota archaeon]NIP40660.1 hypothetical protein [Candidatus Aenigmarchaeota archaeon]NIQ18466.1 hypothetical protein [Candidatus Aenigmarchaeota archaeon]NIS73365.1 hypothetical protein [Candidatus Aenigmarchaeota archaeon]
MANQGITSGKKFCSYYIPDEDGCKKGNYNCPMACGESDELILVRQALCPSFDYSGGKGEDLIGFLRLLGTMDENVRSLAGEKLVRLTYDSFDGFDHGKLKKTAERYANLLETSLRNRIRKKNKFLISARRALVLLYGSSINDHI